MCEQHSPYSPHQKERKANHIRRRRMPFEMVQTLVADMSARGTREFIPTTMGEPLMYKHMGAFFELVGVTPIPR